MATIMMTIIKWVFTNSTKTITIHKNGALHKTKTNLAILREQYKLITVIMQFSWCFLTLKLNSTSAYYQAGIKIQNNTKTLQIHNKTLNRQNKNIMAGYRQYKRNTGTKPLNPEKHT
jgi:hypothetical protein